MTKMKKALALGLAAALAVSFAACSKGSGNDTNDFTPNDSDTAKTGYAVISEIKEDEYNPSETALEIDSVVAAVLVDNDGKVIACQIDEAQTKPDLTENDGNVDDLRTKKAKLDDYGMKPASQIGAEWYEQIAAFEQFTIGKTADEIAAAIGEDGKAADADLAAGCTMYAGTIAKVVVAAIENATDFGASATDTLKLAVKTEKYYESDETNLQYDSNYAIVTTDADGKITSCIIDASQAKCTIADGKFTVEKGTYPTKRELGDDYNMRGVSEQIGIGKEWYEQAAAYQEWAIGKTAAEITAAVGEDYKSNDADLSAGCTITISSIAETVAEAATVA